MIPIRIRLVALPAAALLLASCTADGGPARITAEAPTLSSTTYGATLLECPVSETTSASAVIGPTGGSVSVDGHRLTVPLGALLGLHRFTLTVPAGNYLEVGIQADGQEHFQFRAPVTVTLDYSRCTRNNTRKADLQVLYIDPATKTILQEMGGVDDKTARTVTATTDHLSGYAIGQGRTEEE
jgi:hypothetical protein